MLVICIGYTKRVVHGVQLTELCAHTSRFLDPRTDAFPSTLTAAMAAIDNAIFILVVVR
jgi:hypothetical protein